MAQSQVDMSPCCSGAFSYWRYLGASGSKDSGRLFSTSFLCRWLQVYQHRSGHPPSKKKKNSNPCGFSRILWNRPTHVCLNEACELSIGLLQYIPRNPTTTTIKTLLKISTTSPRGTWWRLNRIAQQFRLSFFVFPDYSCRYMLPSYPIGKEYMILSADE